VNVSVHPDAARALWRSILRFAVAVVVVALGLGVAVGAAVAFAVLR
jgi:uncharacterized membrane protein